MQKERKPLFFKIILLAITMFFLDIGIVVFNNYKSNMTGFSINNLSSLSSLSFSFGFKVFVIFQWIFVILFLVYAKQRDWYIEATEPPLEINKDVSKNKTDLDVLYDLLREQKEIKISKITKTFNISRELALEWGKILESGDLATLNYPGFGEIVLKIKEGHIKPLN